MKLFVDMGDGHSSSFSARYRMPIITGSSVALAVKLERQEKPNWCWAAIAESMAAYFDSGAWNQVSIAKACGCLESSDHGSLLTLNQALDVVGCAFYWTPGKPTFERVMFEINNGLPIGVRIQWHGGLAHFVIIQGYDSETSSLLIGDSIQGSSIQAYHSFPKSYEGQCGVWTETYWTLRPGDKTNELL